MARVGSETKDCVNWRTSTREIYFNYLSQIDDPLISMVTSLSDILMKIGVNTTPSSLKMSDSTD